MNPVDTFSIEKAWLDRGWRPDVLLSEATSVRGPQRSGYKFGSNEEGTSDLPVARLFRRLGFQPRNLIETPKLAPSLGIQASHGKRCR